jgi:hypothetical protein
MNSRNVRNAFCLTLLTLLLGAQSLFAGAVYVPIATNTELQGIRYQTRVWITNAGSGPQEFRAFFIPTVADGTARGGANPTPVSVVPGGTFLLNSVAPPGQRGLFEIDADPDLTVTARLVSILPDGTELIGASVPVISSDNLVQASRTAHVAGVLRRGAAVANLGLVNLGHSPVSCTLKAFRSNATQIAETAVVSLPPLTQAQFDDVLGFIGETAVTDARFEATCNQPYFLYTTLFEVGSGETTFLGPSASGASLLQRPGQTPAPTQCPAGAECYDVPGIFHQPQPGNRVKRISFPVPPGSYRVIKTRVETIIGPWNNPSSGLHNIFWLARNANRDLFGYLNLRGPAQNSVLIRHGIGIPQGQKERIESAFPVVNGALYEWEWIYDTGTRLVEVIVRQGGQELRRFAGGRPNVNQISVGSNDLFHMDFGFDGSNPNEPPTFGWTYQNLHLEFQR